MRLCPRPRYARVRSQRNRDWPQNGNLPANPTSMIINSYVPARPPCRSCVSNDNSKCRESQKLIDSSRSVTNPNPCSRQKYAIFGQAGDRRRWWRRAARFRRERDHGGPGEAQPSMREREKGRDGRTTSDRRIPIRLKGHSGNAAGCAPRMIAWGERKGPMEKSK